MSALLIQNFDQFLDALNLCETGVYSYKEVFESSIIERDEVQQFAAWKSDEYSRVSILRKEDFEVFLLCMEPSQKTEIHNHNGQSGLLYIVEGELKQEIFKGDQGNQKVLVSGQIYKPKMSSEISDNNFQRLSNLSAQKAMAIYMFTKPVKNVQVYQEKTNKISSLKL